MNDPQIAVLAEKVDALEKAISGLRVDLKPLADLAARHDEQIKDLQDRGKWAGGIFSAVLIYVMTKIGLPHI